MTNFANVLSAFIDEKNITINDLIRYTGIDRSSMYKIIKGTRKPPNLDLVKGLATYLCLNRRETNMLIEAYYITTEGEFAYHTRRNVQTFLKDISVELEEKKHENIITISKINLQEGENTTIVGKKYLEHIIQEIILNETATTNPAIKIIEQPDENSSLSTLKMATEINKELSITHLFCLNNNKTIDSKNRFYNLYCFQKIIPFFIANSNYTPYYYYNQINSVKSHFAFFQNVIISSDYVLTYTNDYEYAILYKDNKIRQIYLDLFDKYLENSKVFTTTFNYLEFINSLATSFTANKNTFYFFNTSICPTLILDSEETITANHIIDAFPHKEQFIELFHNYTKLLQDFILNDNNNIFLFTPQGLEFLKNEGYISEIHHSLIEPLSKEERIIFLERWGTLIHNHDNIAMLDMPGHPGFSNITLTFSPTHGIVVFPRADGTLIYVQIEESSLTSVFYDFLDYMYSHHKYDQDVALKEINKNIKKLT